MRTGASEGSRVWETVRRALGRLAAQTSVRRLTESDMTPPITIRVSQTGEPLLLARGAQENAWNPAAAIRQARVPQTQAGMREANLLPSTRLAAGDAALASPVCRAMPAVPSLSCRTEGVELAWLTSAVRLPDAFLTLPAASVRVGTTALLTASGTAGVRLRSLNGGRVEAPKCHALRLPPVPAPRILWGGDSVLSRMALTRRGLEPPGDLPLAQAFGAERHRLAEAAHLPLDDVTLLGVYPGVPIFAVRRLVVAEEGRLLRLWLKPDVLRGRNGNRLITLLVGRQASSGKMLQAAL